MIKTYERSYTSSTNPIAAGRNPSSAGCDNGPAGRLVHARVSVSVDDVRERIRVERDERVDIDAVVLVDDADQILDDVAIVELLVADHDRRMSELASPNPPITVTSSATITDVIDQLIASRRSSVVVVDDDRRPIGRILADDVIDALVPERGRHRLPVPLA